MGAKPTEEGWGALVTGFPCEVMENGPNMHLKSFAWVPGIERRGRLQVDLWQRVVPVDGRRFMELGQQVSSSSLTGMHSLSHA